jgi:hypothetical protein
MVPHSIRPALMKEHATVFLYAIVGTLGIDGRRCEQVVSRAPSPDMYVKGHGFHTLFALLLLLQLLRIWVGCPKRTTRPSL